MRGGGEIEWSGPARRALTRIPERAATAAVEFIYGPLAQDPHRVGRALRLELEGVRSARRGDYRVLYRIDDDRRAVIIEVIAHRADVFRRR